MNKAVILTLAIATSVYAAGASADETVKQGLKRVINNSEAYDMMRVYISQIPEAYTTGIDIYKIEQAQENQHLLAELIKQQKRTNKLLEKLLSKNNKKA